LVCPYHLWKYDGEGKGTSPCNPNMKPFAQKFDVADYMGAIWVKPTESPAKLPEMDVEGLHYIGLDTGVINAPFQLVVDNFIEIEHSPTNHGIFAFDAKGITEVVPDVKTEGESIHVIYEGPQRQVPLLSFTRFIMKPGTRLVIDFMVHFQPIHFIYNMRWYDTQTKQQLPNHIREFAFLTPTNKGETQVFLFFFSTFGMFKPSLPSVLRSIAAKNFLKMAHSEFLLDKYIVEEVAKTDEGTELKGLQLGKFDRVLRETRRLIASVYHRDLTKEVPEAPPQSPLPAATGTDG
jgi:phenylpropionate dioxygenase-like ring-hydroxylating dioxygenase large terminal subunit